MAQSNIFFTYKIYLWKTGVENSLNNCHINAATASRADNFYNACIFLCVLQNIRFNLKNMH